MYFFIYIVHLATSNFVQFYEKRGYMKIPFEIYPPLKVTVTMRKEKRETKGYRNRYDIIDHGHKKITFMYFFKDLWCIEGILYYRVFKLDLSETKQLLSHQKCTFKS